jgi:hypothetical protein
MEIFVEQLHPLAVEGEYSFFAVNLAPWAGSDVVDPLNIVAKQGQERRDITSFP